MPHGPLKGILAEAELLADNLRADLVIKGQRAVIAGDDRQDLLCVRPCLLYTSPSPRDA